MNGTHARRADRAGIAIAVILFACAIVIWLDVSRLEISSTYGLGPKAMPFVVATGLGILAIANFLVALRGELPER